jgi:hypothetical protein
MQLINEMYETVKSQIVWKIQQQQQSCKAQKQPFEYNLVFQHLYIYLYNSYLL